MMPKKRTETLREDSGMQKKLYLVPLDETSRGLADWMTQQLANRYKFKINSGLVAKLPDEAFNSQRSSYYSSVILNKIQFLKASEDELMLAITEEDLFTPNTEFVLSDSDKLAGVGIISTQRLRPEFHGLPYDNEILRTRALKKAVHEIGHLLGLENCENENCVMFSSKDITEVDFQMDRYCQQCMVALSLPVKVPKT
ncbi:MAG: hypothetical protein GY855_14395 [candidate division Zixibacteria bacterium]|nr:hypothetical protein [candidate division Zixibacteria bacterium]